MSGMLACLAAALVGVEPGWQPLPGGGMEYILQIKPGTREALHPNEAIESDVPEAVRDVRHVRIVVGRDALPKKLPDPVPAGGAPAGGAPARGSAASPPPSAERWPGRAAAGGASGSPLTAGPWGAKAFAPSSPLKGPASPPPPAALSPDPAGKPLIAQSAGFLEPSGTSGQGGSSSPAVQSPAPAEPQKPWRALWLTALMLCGSLGGNVYLGWIAWGTRSRCRAMLRTADPSAKPHAAGI
jgi:hypothetical protein